jgi:hypothetical protein
MGDPPTRSRKTWVVDRNPARAVVADEVAVWICDDEIAMGDDKQTPPTSFIGSAEIFRRFVAYPWRSPNSRGACSWRQRLTVMPQVQTAIRKCCD